MFAQLTQRLMHLVAPNGPAAAALLAAVLSTLLPHAANATAPGKTYCFNGICHRVNTLQEMAALVGKDQTFKTSFYDDCKHDRYNPCGLTASGEVFRPNDADNAASPIFPQGTVLLVRNPANGQSAVVRVNNAGPYWGKRKLDVSRGTAEKLGFKKRGVATLEVRVMSAPTAAEAKYKKNRRYDAVPGAIGVFASLDRAQGAQGSQGGIMMAMDQEPKQASPFATLASADMMSLNNAAEAAAGGSPADGLKAAARRAYGIEQPIKSLAPASLTAGIAPIHRSRSRYWRFASVQG